MIHSHIFMVINVVFLFHNVRCEVFTAIVDLEDVVYTEQALVTTLEKYIQFEEQKINHLKGYLAMFQKEHQKAVVDVQLYLSNPLNAYKLIKRLTTDWTQVEKLILTNKTKDIMADVTNYKKHMQFPTDEDLKGAAEALFRLQDTYKLDTATLARGELNGVKYGTELSADDCFELGRQAYNKEDYYYTKLWMEEAEARVKREANSTVEYSDILEYLTFSLYEQGNFPLAFNLTKKLLDIVPTHGRASLNIPYIEKKLWEFEESKGIKRDDGSEAIENPGARYEDLYQYSDLCRGEQTLPVEDQTNLKCRYLSRDNPFLKIAPFKVEEAYLDPDLYIFHDVMSDSEIETLKVLSPPRFLRAGVVNGEVDGVTDYRIGKMAWIADDQHKQISDIAQRVTDMTGLTMETSEDLQVSNYGIGGFYTLHYDFQTEEEKNFYSNLPELDPPRIATVLFYMSDVDQGGATVFPYLRTAIQPKKGTAVFWYNLFSSGDGDVRLCHAACPVLSGSKWVTTKWIHEGGQVFLRPCTKERPPQELTI